MQTTRYEVRFADLQRQDVAVVRGDVAADELESFLGRAFGQVMMTAQRQEIAVVGPPFGRYRPGDGGFQVMAGFPVARAVAPEGDVVPDVLPGGHVATTMHVGAYDKVGDAYEAATDTAVRNGYEPAGPGWECYLDEPDVAEPRTEVFVPCRPVRPHRPEG